jgi:hypothetical protein
MGVQTEQAHAGEFLISEASRTRSRQNIVIGASQTLAVGALLASLIVGSATAAAVAASGNTGNGVMGAVTVDANAPIGVYRVVIIEPATNGGAFSVEKPDGTVDSTGKVAVAYNGLINFTLADGATDFVAGDAWEITVTLGSATEQYVAWTVGQTAKGILFDAVTTGAGETAKAVMIDGDAEVNGYLIAYPTGASASDKVEAREQLRRLGIKVRSVTG